ncbi:H(+)-transporting V1 sector ATPase subunit D [Conglomerata obtusa]
MANDQKLQIFPTRMNLTITKIRHKSAEKGHILLKRKSDALQKRHREIQQTLQNRKKDVENVLKDAFFSLTEAEFVGADFKMYLHECRKHPIHVITKMEQVSGVILPAFSLSEEYEKILFYDRSGLAMNRSRKKFLFALKLLIDVSSLQNSFMILEEVLKGVNRRVNALEFLLIPRLNNTINYINAELDEQDREEFFRLKKIQKLKKEDY